jgi:hypothetical protein
VRAKEVKLLLYPANQIVDGSLDEEAEEVLRNANFPDGLRFRVERRFPVYLPTTFEVRHFCNDIRKIREDVGGVLWKAERLRPKQLNTIYHCFAHNFCPLGLEYLLKTLTIDRTAIPVFLLPFPPRVEADGYIHMSKNGRPCILILFQSHQKDYSLLVHELYHVLSRGRRRHCPRWHCQKEDCAVHPVPGSTKICDDCRNRLAKVIKAPRPREGVR